jgi:hypothetical protein
MSMFWIRNAPRKTPLGVGVALAEKEANKIKDEKAKEEGKVASTGAGEGGAADNEKGTDDHYKNADSATIATK